MHAWTALEEEEEVEERLDELRHASMAADSALLAFSRHLMAIEAEGEASDANTRLRAAAAAGDEARRACREMELELNSMASDGELPEDAERQMRAMVSDGTRRLERLFATLTFLREARRREELLTGVGRAVRTVEMADQHSPSVLVALGMRTQIESQQAVMRMARMVESAKGVGAATLTTLGAQSGRLQRVRASVGAQYEQVSMAERELRAFAESALGDYLTLALLMMIGVALVGIAVQRLSGDAPSPGITLAAGLTPAGLSSAAASWPTVVYSALDLRTL